MTAEVQKYTLAQIEALELAPGAEHEQLEGWVPALASDEDLRQALEKAFDYRGDVTLTLKSGERIEAYIFNRQTGATLADSWVQYFTPTAPKSAKSATPRSPASNSPAKTAPPASTGKTGSRPRTKRKPPAKRTSRCIPTRWNSSRPILLRTGSSSRRPRTNAHV